MRIIRHPTFGLHEIETIRLNGEISFTISSSLHKRSLPSNGGIRWSHYTSSEAQEEEALKLAHCMDLKHSLYRTGFSGGKIVVNSDVSPEEALYVFDAIGEALNRYGGTMYSGCDVNTNNVHMLRLLESTPWVLGCGNAAIDTSVATGYGIWRALLTLWDTSLAQATRWTPLIAIHGLGKVGSEVARQCLAQGYQVIGFDKSPSAAIPAAVCMLDEGTFWSRPSDVLCVASVSGVLDSAAVAALRTRWVIGGANAPFENATTESALLSRGIGYLPDYLCNAGAVICDSIEKGFPEVFRALTQAEANEYVGFLIDTKVKELMMRAEMLGCTVSTVLASTEETAGIWTGQEERARHHVIRAAASIYRPLLRKLF